MSVGLYSGTSGLALGVGLWSGVPGFWSGAAGLIDGLGAALDLNFLAGAPLDSRITFSRGTQATLTDSTGKITYAPNNLLTNSESFEASSWTKTRASITANSTVAPDGTTTADKLVEDTTASNSHITSQTVSIAAGASYTFSVYLKPDGRNFARVLVGDTGGNNGVRVTVNLSTGETATGTAGTGWTLTSASATEVGNGWYRVSVSGSNATATTGVVIIYLATSLTIVSYTGDGTSGIYLWGAQLEQVTYQTTPGTYNSTTPKNLLGYTQEFDNAYWTKGSTSVTANVATAPDGTVSADKLITNSGALLSSTTTLLRSSIVNKAASATTYAFTFYAKASEFNRARVLLVDASASGNNASFTFSLVDGSITTAAVASGTFTAASASVTNAGNGWYRAALICTSGTETGLYARIGAADSTATTGDGISGIYIWGAQLSNSASVDPYVYNPGAAPTSAAYYGPRFDYDPVTLAPKGLLIEEQRTNLVTYSEQFDNAAWQKSGASITADTSIAPSGANTADTITEDTANSGHSVEPISVSFTSGVSYTLSVYAKASSGIRGVCLRFASAAFPSSSRTAFFSIANGTVVSNEAGTTATITNIGGGWYRCALTATASATAATRVGSIILTDASNNRVYTGDGTSGLYIWGAQVEAGAFATSYIPTVASTVTRSADVAQMLGDNFTSWYNQSEGTFVAFADTLKPSGLAQTANLNSANDGTSSNAVSLRFGTSNATGLVQTGGTAQTGFAGTAYTANTPVKWGMAYQLNNTALCVAGGSVTTDTSVTVGLTMTQMNIGARNGALDPLNGHVQSIQYYNTRLPNDQLQAISA